MLIAGSCQNGRQGRHYSRVRNRHCGHGARCITASPLHSARGSADIGARFPPVGIDGTERRIERPQNPTEQMCCDRDKKKGHTVENVLLLNGALTTLLLSDTYAGSVHDERVAETTPDPLPAGSRLLQD